ncbi:MAG: lipid A deacylase LpxR family protein [Rhodospirillaceae bacterium]|nr:lipid A deacylase LpxR family protein [Rhodospirillaceae bacterium]MBT6203800.1 lipid A deacylase LpxR family protein [Rhodospirillaceae bacterium]MBT6511420.1 lipid A deacylase LpxR family protein [Rhodospirillaceae bacterium]MBT7645553.1 lipid A deacylase LpxR family protein [Rhodospirillaceae bacterium]
MAQEPGPIITFQAENDFFVSSGDGQYTHGMQASYLSGANDVPDFIVGTAEWLPIFETGSDMRWGISVAQSMFTPDDIQSTGLIEDDQPYAGWLRTDIGLVSDTGDRLDRVSLSLGIVGPQSYAEDTQVWFHEVIEASRPNGWDHQLSNEPAVNLFYERQYRLVKPVGLEGLDLEWDFTPRGSIALGNVYTYGAIGAEFRIGQQLEQDYGAPRIGAGVAGSGYFLPVAWNEVGWYFFAGLEGRAVARNIFLDGNTFADSHSVSKNIFVGEFQAGAAVTWGHMRLTFTHVLRSKEFEGQDAPDQFGAISLSTTF